MALSKRTVLTCLWRTTHINAAMTTRGMQQIGLTYVLAPALEELYQEPEARVRAFARYAEHSNTHAFMLPCYAGILIAMESQIARNAMPEALMTQLRQTLARTLSALGDGFFSGALRTLWALIAICLVLEGHTIAAAVFTAILLAMLEHFRAIGFFYCLNNGIAALKRLRSIDLISWTERIKIFNAGLVCLTLLCIIDTSTIDWPWEGKMGLVASVPLCSWLVGRLHIPRELVWIMALGFFILLDEGLIHL